MTYEQKAIQFMREADQQVDLVVNAPERIKAKLWLLVAYGVVLALLSISASVEALAGRREER